MKIIDTHSDITLKFSGKNKIEYLKKCKDEGVSCIFYSIWTTQYKQPFRAIKHASAFVLGQKLPLNLLLHVEDLWFIKTEADLNKLISFKPFSCGLVWNEKNCIGSGAFVDGGLTAWGKAVVEKLIKNNIIIDLAHCNEQTFFEVSKIVKKNLFVSHTAFKNGFVGNESDCEKQCEKQCCKHLNKTFSCLNCPRNLSDKQAKLVAKSGGFIGLYLVREFIGNFQKQIEYAKKLGLENFIGLGTDFCGTTDLPKEFNSYKKLQKLENEKFLFKNFENFLNKV